MGVIINEHVTYVAVDKESNKLVIKNKDNHQIIDGIDGKLMGISRQQKKLDDGTELDKLEIEILDDRRYKITLGFHSNAAHNLVNSLLGSPKLYQQHFKLSTYKKDGYPKSYIELNNMQARWKYGMDVVPPVETIKLKSGKEQKDDSLKQDFFEKAYIELKNKFDGDKQKYHTELEAF